jgi:hypothetical protein
LNGAGGDEQVCYRSFSSYLKEKYGEKVRRISLDAGFGCPHRGAAEGAGCAFCNERAFSGSGGAALPIKDRIEHTAAALKKKYGVRKFIAYFQNGTSTNADPASIRRVYDDVLRADVDIVGLFISTRPDCVDREKLEVIKEYTPKYEVWMEYGVQTVDDDRLRRLKRGHDFNSSVKAVNLTREFGIKCAAHLMLGLPGEDNSTFRNEARTISSLELDGVKVHALHVLRNTLFEKEYLEGKLHTVSRRDYVLRVCDLLERLSPECVILRLVPDAREKYLIAPGWMNDKTGVINDIKKEFKARGSFQGALYGSSKDPGER